MALPNLLSTSQPKLRSGRLDAHHLAGLVAMGALFWLVGVGVVRAIEPLDVLAGRWTTILFLCVLALTVPVVVLTPRILGVPQGQAMACATVMVATAALIDAVVVR